MQAEGLRGLPDTLRVNRHLAAACPDLASSLAKIGVNLRITDSADKNHPAALRSAQDAARSDLERDQKAATQSPLLGGVFIECLTPDFGQPLEVHHRLGRKPQGWIPVRALDAIFDMYEVDSPDPNLTLVLERGPGASVDSRFTLYIF